MCSLFSSRLRKVRVHLLLLAEHSCGNIGGAPWSFRCSLWYLCTALLIEVFIERARHFVATFHFYRRPRGPNSSTRDKDCFQLLCRVIWDKTPDRLAPPGFELASHRQHFERTNDRGGRCLSTRRRHLFFSRAHSPSSTQKTKQRKLNRGRKFHTKIKLCTQRSTSVGRHV